MTTKHQNKYMSRITCPKCGREGELFETFSRATDHSKWCGPYYRVLHNKTVHDSKKYYKLRHEQNLSRKEAINKGRKHLYIGDCWFGKNLPLRVIVQLKNKDKKMIKIEPN